MSGLEFYPTHDVGSGMRLADWFGDRFRWVADLRFWIVWDGRRWERQPDDVKVEGIAKEAALLIADEARALLDDDTRTRHLRWAADSMSMARIRAAVAAAKSVESIQVQSDQLDADPLLINCRNGTFDVSTGEVQGHDPEDLITRLVPHDYVPGAYAPSWWALLRRATQLDSSGATADFLAMVLGYCLIGGNPEHRIFFVVGPAGTGKSQVVEVPNAVIGTDYSWVSKPTLITRGRSDVHTEETAVLRSKRLVIVSETDGAMKLDEAAVKAFTGSQRIAVRPLYGKQEQVSLEATIIVSTNEPPTVEKFDDAVQRRLTMIPSGPPLAPHEKDINLQRKIVKEEAVGVVASLLDGARRWFELSHGLGQEDGPNDTPVFDTYVPAAVEAETTLFAHDADPVREFMDECVEFGDGLKVPLPAVNRAYEEFRRSGHRIGRRRLYDRIVELSEQRGDVGVYKDQRNLYGLRLLPVQHSFEASGA